MCCVSSLRRSAFVGPRRARVRTGGGVGFVSPTNVSGLRGDAAEAWVETCVGVPANRTTNSPKVRTCSRWTVLSAVTRPNCCRTQAVDSGNCETGSCSDTAKDRTRYCLNTQLTKAKPAIPKAVHTPTSPARFLLAMVLMVYTFHFERVLQQTPSRHEL